jgi:geranylgeranyl diphosphate synthase type 3
MPTAHTIYGVPSTINCANYIYVQAMDLLCKELPEKYLLESTKIFIRRMLQLHQGQGMDIYWRDCVVCPSLEDYLKMIENKTTGLFGLALDLLRIFSTNKTDYSPLVCKMGEYFQIRDDYANLKFAEVSFVKVNFVIFSN